MLYPYAIVFTLTSAMCSVGFDCCAQDVRPVIELALPSGEWQRPAIFSKSKVLILHRPVGQRNILHEAVLGDIQNTNKELLITAHHKDVETAIIIGSANSDSYLTVSGGEATLRDGDGMVLNNWKLAPEYFTPDSAFRPHFGTIALRSINLETGSASLWRIDITRDSVTRFATRRKMNILIQPTAADRVIVFEDDGNHNVLQEYDRDGDAGKSTTVPKGFLASAATADGLQVWGRAIRTDGESTQIAFIEIRDPAKVTTVSPNDWHTVEPLVSALGDVAFCRIISRDRAQHLCIFSDGRVRTIHERLVPGGYRFNWSDSGRELISIVSDDDGHELVRVDPVDEPNL